MVGKYKVITLCGSTRFRDEFMEAQKRLTLEGNIVISVGLFGHSGDNEVWENMDEGTLTKTKEMWTICIRERSIWQMRSLLSMSAATSGPVPGPRLYMQRRLGNRSGIWKRFSVLDGGAGFRFVQGFSCGLE